MLLQLDIVVIRERKGLEDLPGGLPCKSFLVGRIADQGVSLHPGLRIVQQNPQVLEAGVVVGVDDVRKARAHLVDHRLVLQRIGDHRHSLREVALVEDGAVPGEDHGDVLCFALLHAVREIFQDAVVQARLLLAVKNLRDRKRLIMQILLVGGVNSPAVLVADAAPDKGVHRIEIGGHESGGHLRILRISLEDLPCGPLAEFRELHVAVVIGNRQTLVLRAALRNLQHALHGVLRLVKAQRPQARDGLHAVVGAGHLQGLVRVPDGLADPGEELIRDPVHGVEIANAGPGRNGALYGRKPKQVVIFNSLQNSEKAFRPPAVCVLADRLAHAFLEPCGHKEPCQKIVELSVSRLHDSPDQRH